MEGSDCGADFGKHRALCAEDFVVVIPAAALDKKCLPHGSECVASLDCAGDHCKTLSEVGVWKCDAGWQRRSAGSGENLVGIERLLLSLVKGLRKEIAVLLRELRIDGSGHGILQVLVLLPRGIIAAERDGSIGGNAVFGDIISGLPDIRSIERNLHRHDLAAVRIAQDIGHSAAPADAAAGMGDAGLPLLDLVTVRIESERQAPEVLRDLRAVRYRLDKSADVRHKGRLAIFKK